MIVIPFSILEIFLMALGLSLLSTPWMIASLAVLIHLVMKEAKNTIISQNNQRGK